MGDARVRRKPALNSQLATTQTIVTVPHGTYSVERAAAEAMRRILVESAHCRNSRKRGGERKRVEMEELDVAAMAASDPDLLLDIDAGLSRLVDEDSQAAELLKLRLYAGLSVAERVKCLACPVRWLSKPGDSFAVGSPFTAGG